MNYEKLILGRQPILDVDGETFGYELLFRNAFINKAEICDNTSATSRVIVDIYHNFGVEKLLGGKVGFVNINETILLQDMIDMLPPEHFVFEIIENTVVSPSLIEKMKRYKEKGYKFALDDLCFTEEYMLMFKDIIPLSDFLKVDFILSSRKDILYRTRELSKFPGVLLAEKIETDEDFIFAKKAGFHLFQGYFFARPNILSKSSIEPSKLSVLKLLNLLSRDCPIEKVEIEFKLQPEFSIKLLKFINSSSFFVRSEIKSIRHAITLLGRHQLQKWLIVMLYASKNKTQTRSPLLETVLLRARAMELLTERIYGKNTTITGDAYFTGLLSLLDVIFCISAEELMESLNIEGEIRLAVEKREGRLGDLLRLIETSDDDAKTIKSELLEKYKITPDELSSIKYLSFEWMADQQLLHDSDSLNN
jgi:EAL and modified HD-GYP domain-containing signal transduction protein